MVLTNLVLLGTVYLHQTNYGKYGGTYTIWPGTYNLTVVADGYDAAAAEAVVIDNDALTTIDFAMVEIPYAVSNVVATPL